MKKVVGFFLFSISILNGDLFASKLSIVGATTVQPIIEQVSAQYKKETGVDLKIQGGGSKFGIDSVRLKNADIGMMNRALSESEKEEVDHLTIAYDSLVFIVNDENPINEITTQQIEDIFTGKITNWKTINQNDSQIILISKDPGRGTMQNFSSVFKLYHPLDEKNSDNTKMILPTAWDARGNNDTLVWVGGLKSAIGFISYGSAEKSIKKNMPIKIIKLDKVMPTIKTISNQTYKLRFELNVVYNKTNQEAMKFCNWLLGKYTQDVVKQNGFIGVKNYE